MERQRSMVTRKISLSGKLSSNLDLHYLCYDLFFIKKLVNKSVYARRSCQICKRLKTSGKPAFLEKFEVRFSHSFSSSCKRKLLIKIQ